MPELYDAEGTPVDDRRAAGRRLRLRRARATSSSIVTEATTTATTTATQYEDEARRRRVRRGRQVRRILGTRPRRLGGKARPVRAPWRALGQASRRVARRRQGRQAFGRQERGRRCSATRRGRRRRGRRLRRRQLRQVLGQEVLETLSKALTDSERDEVIAKAIDVVEEVSKRNDDLEEVVAGLLEDRERGDYVELAKGYELPVDDDELGGLLHRAAQRARPGRPGDRWTGSSPAPPRSTRRSTSEIGYDGLRSRPTSSSQVYAACRPGRRQERRARHHPRAGRHGPVRRQPRRVRRVRGRAAHQR